MDDEVFEAPSHDWAAERLTAIAHVMAETAKSVPESELHQRGLRSIDKVLQLFDSDIEALKKPGLVVPFRDVKK
jgi:hypothetical protein